MRRTATVLARFGDQEVSLNVTLDRVPRTPAIPGCYPMTDLRIEMPEGLPILQIAYEDIMLALEATHD